MNFKFAILASAIALGSASAQAAVYDFGVHAPLEISALVTAGAGIVGTGSFADFYTFELTGGSQSVSSTVVATNIGSVLGITGGQYGVFSVGSNGTFEAGFGDDGLVPGSGYNYSGSSGSTTNSVTLGAGKYYYAVMGSATGVAGGYYTLTSAVTAVPEPETYLLMFAGLGAIGFVASRRKAR